MFAAILPIPTEANALKLLGERPEPMLRLSRLPTSNDPTAEDRPGPSFAPLDLGFTGHAPERHAPGDQAQAQANHAPDYQAQGNQLQDSHPLGNHPLPNHPLSGHALDQLADFAPMVTAVRLVTVAIGLILAAPSIIAGDLGVTAAAVVVTGYSTLRAIRPVSFGVAGDVSKRLVAEGILFA
ncbi:MAG: hypothetical protein GX868_05500, partial [Actinobacteria bacterium]|nr:hypothetical protein [Actinomycetota bacterium]